jgi:hypothetical protein
MHLTRVVLAGQSRPTQPQAEIVLDALWAHLGPGHGVEHITATAAPHGIVLAVFLRHEVTGSDEDVGKLIDTISANSPALHRWRRAVPH